MKERLDVALFTKTEHDLIGLLAAKDHASNITLIRKSSKPFDLRIDGQKQFGSVDVRFSSWLPLWAIHSLVDWTNAEVMEMSDYPNMAGDWSAIRDTSEASLWAIFEKFVVPKL